jgi:xanthine dehydrogenase YagT iron-sulfur-binding subunit
MRKVSLITEAGSGMGASASRRKFLKIGVVSASTIPTLAHATAGSAASETPPSHNDGLREQRIVLNVNGTARALTVPPNAILLDVLRDRLHLTGTKKGCDHGQCGACTIHVNGQSVNACLSVAIQHDGDEITTIEGLALDGHLHAVQAAFWEHDAYQCGYCTPGQIMSAVAILRDPTIAADDASVREAMSGNICRCAAYKNILAAIQCARAKLKESANA